jgi:hypothetical protein
VTSKKEFKVMAQILGEEMAMCEAQGKHVGPLNMVANRMGNHFKYTSANFDEGTWYGYISDVKEDTLKLIGQGAINARQGANGV